MQLLPHACPIFKEEPIASIIAYEFVCDYRNQGHIFLGDYWDKTNSTFKEWIDQGYLAKYIDRINIKYQ